MPPTAGRLTIWWSQPSVHSSQKGWLFVGVRVLTQATSRSLTFQISGCILLASNCSQKCKELVTIFLESIPKPSEAKKNPAQVTNLLC